MCSSDLGKFMFLFGKRGTGKSVMHLYLLLQNADQFYMGVAISKVAPSVQGFERCFPKSLVYADHDDEVIQRISSLAELFVKNEAWPMDNWIINVDDASTKRNALNSDSLKKLAMQGRHLSVTVIIAVQYFKIGRAHV